MSVGRSFGLFGPSAGAGGCVGTRRPRRRSPRGSGNDGGTGDALDKRERARDDGDGAGFLPTLPGERSYKWENAELIRKRETLSSAPTFPSVSFPPFSFFAVLPNPAFSFLFLSPGPASSPSVSPARLFLLINLTSQLFPIIPISLLISMPSAFCSFLVSLSVCLSIGLLLFLDTIAFALR